MHTAQKYIVYYNPSNIDYETIEYMINEKLSPIGGHFENNTFIFRQHVIVVSAMCLVENVVLFPIDPIQSNALISASYETDFIDKSQNQTWEDFAQDMIEFNN